LIDCAPFIRFVVTLLLLYTQGMVAKQASVLSAVSPMCVSVLLSAE